MKINRVTTILGLLISIITISCSNKYENIVKVEIPTELKDNTEAVELINDMTISINKALTAAKNDSILKAVTDSSSAVDRSIIIRNIKSSIIMMKMVILLTDMNDFESRKAHIDSSLSSTQLTKLNNVYGGIVHNISEEPSLIENDEYVYDDELDETPSESPIFSYIDILIGAVILILIAIRLFYRVIDRSDSLKYAAKDLKHVAKKVIDDPKSLKNRDVAERGFFGLKSIYNIIKNILR